MLFFYYYVKLLIKGFFNKHFISYYQHTPEFFWSGIKKICRYCRKSAVLKAPELPSCHKSQQKVWQPNLLQFEKPHSTLIPFKTGTFRFKSLQKDPISRRSTTKKAKRIELSPWSPTGGGDCLRWPNTLPRCLIWLGVGLISVAQCTFIGYDHHTPNNWFQGVRWRDRRRSSFHHGVQLEWAELGEAIVLDVPILCPDV